MLKNIINTIIEWYGKNIAAKTNTKLDDHFLPIFEKFVYIIVFGLTFIWILGQLGIEVTTLIAAMGIGGLAIALALQPTLSNFFSGAQYTRGAAASLLIAALIVFLLVIFRRSLEVEDPYRA